MISLKRWRLFPRSLRQLVIMAFLLVLLPLLVLAYQAYDSLDTLSYRQYCVLDDSTLATLY